LACPKSGQALNAQHSLLAALYRIGWWQKKHFLLQHLVLPLSYSYHRPHSPTKFLWSLLTPFYRRKGFFCWMLRC
jgi:hypothetical protein